nr:putative ribonuclease H-like domain-containing protein [Tanacetum cinerariifolium]
LYGIAKVEMEFSDVGLSGVCLLEQGSRLRGTGMDYEEIDGGYVALGGNPKGGKITRKGKAAQSLFLMKKMYSLVVTDDYNRFTRVFFLATKDETSGILKSFITRIENLVDHKVKVIRCDNGTGFKNREMNQFYEMKGILRQYSIAGTPQQNGVAERRDRTLIEVARTMLADSNLPTTFWAKAVNTACYVQNRVLVVKPHNKTPYELFHGKFDGKADEGFFVGYSLNSNAFRVFNSRARIVEENLHSRFSESTPNVVCSGPDWLLDIDALIRTINYEPIVIGTQSNGFARTKASDNADPKSSHDDGSKPLSNDGKKVEEDPRKENECNDQEKKDTVNITNNVNTVSSTVNTAGTNEDNELPFDPNMPALEDKYGFTEVKTASTRIETQKPLLKDEDGEKVDVHMYRSMIGSLMYLTSSRPDIMLAVCACARYQVNPNVSNLHIVKRIFRYLKGQPKLGLWYPKDSLFDLVAYTNSDYAEASLDMKSTTGGKAKKCVRLMMEKFFGMELELTMEAQLHARVDGKKIIITEASIRRDLQLIDEEGVDCLPNSTIFEQLALMGVERSLVRVVTTASSLEAEQDSGNINKTQSKATPNESSSQGTDSGGGPRFQEAIGDTTTQTRVLDLEKIKTSQRNEIDSLKKRVKKLEKKNRSRTHKLKRLYKVGLTARVESSNDEERLALEALKTSKPKVKGIVIQEQEEPSKSTTTTATIPKLQSQDKGKEIMIEEPVKPKKKDQIRLNEEAAKRLQAEFDKEVRFAREKAKKEQEANIALIETWDDIRAKIDVDH